MIDKEGLEFFHFDKLSKEKLRHWTDFRVLNFLCVSKFK